MDFGSNLGVVVEAVGSVGEKVLVVDVSKLSLVLVGNLLKSRPVERGESLLKVLILVNLGGRLDFGISGGEAGLRGGGGLLHRLDDGLIGGCNNDSGSHGVFWMRILSCRNQIQRGGGGGERLRFYGGRYTTTTALDVVGSMGYGVGPAWPTLIQVDSFDPLKVARLRTAVCLLGHLICEVLRLRRRHRPLLYPNVADPCEDGVKTIVTQPNDHDFSSQTPSPQLDTDGAPGLSESKRKFRIRGKLSYRGGVG